MSAEKCHPGERSEGAERIVDGVPPLGNLHLQGLGEPMMHPHFFDMVEYAAGEGVKVTTNSNFTLLNPRRAERLPRYRSGGEVPAQNLLMRRWGGCGILPSGTYYSEIPSTVLNEAGTVDGHALDLLPEMAARYAATEGRRTEDEAVRMAGEQTLPPINPQYLTPGA